jgi:tryptophan synthase alpha chain
MTAITAHLHALKNNRQCALIPFITAGDPDLETTAAALRCLDGNGADLIELGIPYSDPLADGPVIQAAATRALASGTTMDAVLEMVAEVSPSLRSPLILFTYYNPILNRGLDSFFKQIAQVGVKGLVIPDLPVEEALDVLQTGSRYGVEVILLVAPTSSLDRMATIAQHAQGFIYLVSVTGVTGVRAHVQSCVQEQIAHLHQLTSKPIGVGFGISSPQQARQVMNWGADAVIVGSAFVNLLYQIQLNLH